MEQSMKPTGKGTFGGNIYANCEQADDVGVKSNDRKCKLLNGTEGSSSNGNYWCSVATQSRMCPLGLK